MGFPGHCLLPAGRPRGRSSAACSGAGYTRIPILLAWLWEPPCASAELCQERVDSRVEEGAIYDIEEQLHTRDTSPAALQRFLLAIPLACLAALQRGEDTLAPRCCKDTMVARLVEIMEDSPPPLVLADCLNAACSLSTLQPPLRAQLLSPLLTAAVGQTVSGDWQQEPIHTQQFIRALPYDLQALLASLLAESPDTARLQLIMEHLSPWLESRLPQERARALGSTTALLGVATTLPGFDNSADWPRMGHHVAQLGLFISDPSEDVSRLAREGVHSLYQLLLHHRGLNIHQAEDLWCRHYYKERWVLAHSNSVRVGEVFGQLFTPEQENCFLDKALLAARSPPTAPQPGRAGPGPRPAWAGPSAPGIHGRHPVRAARAEEPAAASPSPQPSQLY
ncbi:maestro heat-like repeat-containing protein family member 7 isoform X2 [Pelodiscus sinensis]|uniref:maestro heat-like repeat-containing protein family member 7 isoform X2 n=1 Tax=Pelodiscus sinensis TaxID=13735 RepID=UPI003F6B8ACE